MKKLALMAVTAIALMAVVSCGEKSPKANLKTDVDSLSYALGVDRSDQVINEVFPQTQIDSAYVDDFIKGVLEGANAGDNKKDAAYNIGLSYGMMIANLTKSINDELAQATGDSLKKVSLKNMLAGLVSELKNKNTTMPKEKAVIFLQNYTKKLQQQAMATQAKKAEKEYGPYKKQNEAWLVANAKKEGVQTLKDGLQFKVVKEGNGQKPQIGSAVKVNYVLTDIEGNKLDGNDGARFQLQPGGLVPGFIEGLQQMSVGAKYEIYIPQELGYGAQGYNSIKPFTTLIFTVELLSIEDAK